MKFTGERIIPGADYLKYPFLRHLVAYDFAVKFFVGKNILDAGSGEGYGSYKLAEKCKYVTGLDQSKIAIKHAKESYVCENIKFICGNVEKLPFPDNSFDGACSFQVIEHLSNYSCFLDELKRVVVDDGVVLISTPNKKTFSPSGEILDPYHLKEFTANELKKELSNCFTSVDLYYLTGNEKVLQLLALDQKQTKKILAIDLLKIRTLVPLLIRKIIYKYVLKYIRSLNSRKNNELVKELNIEDFILTKNKDQEFCSIDLIAVCKN